MLMKNVDKISMNVVADTKREANKRSDNLPMH